jgi:hypothetical protein
MIPRSEIADRHIPAFAPVVPPRHVSGPLKLSVVPAKLAMKDTLIASAFLCAYMTLYLAAGFVGVSAIEWAWAYISR